MIAHMNNDDYDFLRSTKVPIPNLVQGHIFPPAEIDILANAFHLVPRVEPRTATGNETFTAKNGLTLQRLYYSV